MSVNSTPADSHAWISSRVFEETAGFVFSATRVPSTATACADKFNILS